MWVSAMRLGSATRYPVGTPITSSVGCGTIPASRRFTGSEPTATTSHPMTTTTGARSSPACDENRGDARRGLRTQAGGPVYGGRERCDVVAGVPAVFRGADDQHRVVN